MGGKNGKKGNTKAKSKSKVATNEIRNNLSNDAIATMDEPSKTLITQTTTTVVEETIVTKGGENSIHLQDIAFYVSIALTISISLLNAYAIRLHAIREFGPVIHEFDPYFNYRATEYLYYNGWRKFFTWFDHKSWYPLGRPVGTTIYPGMQITAVFIKNYIVGDSMSLNDVCCYIPAWFGVIATILTGLIAYECSLECNTRSQILLVLWNLIAPKQHQLKERQLATNKNEKSKKWKTAIVCGTLSTFVMAIAPAHLMRSIGGGFDNESIAISTMMLTFYFWIRSLRSGENYSFLFGILTGIAYFYMVATWGGYVFVLNMIGLHAAILVGLGRFNTKIYLSYTLFYIIGTSLAVQIPVVGWTPLKSLEQLGCFAIFIGYQVLFVTEKFVQKKKLTGMKAWSLRIRLYTSLAVLGIVLALFFLPKNYFGPISSRVRGLFVKHTKTGNPLVDSVAEHQPAKASAYFQYLHQLCTFAPFGFMTVFIHFGDSPSFLSAYAIAAYYFSLKMVRLVLLIGPIASILGGIGAGHILVWSFVQLFKEEEESKKKKVETEESSQNTTKKKKSKKIKTVAHKDDELNLEGFQSDIMNSPFGNWLKRVISFILLLTIYFSGTAFHDYSWSISVHMSNPAIIRKGTMRNGTTVHIDDYREAYWWIRDNTPEDARIMAWWDYGYQISAIANRTTIADGNTWNHEHIALLGKIFTTDVDEAHSIARHLADYILVWAGGGGDDLAKSPHLARIANSVYREMCPDDPVCSNFGLVPVRRGLEHRAVHNGMMPSPKMHASLVNHLVGDGMRDVKVDPEMFKEVFRTKYGKVRIYKIIGVDEESKTWAADPNNRICDAPGSWYCRGQYPPALQEVLKKGKTFVQLEDFNKNDEDAEYQKQYMDSWKRKREKKDQKVKAQKIKKMQTVRNDL